MAIKLEDITIYGAHDREAKRVRIGWSDGEARYHFWFELPRGGILHDRGRGMKVLYKNPLLGAQDQYRTRYLDAASFSNRLNIKAVLHLVKENDLINKAFAAEAEGRAAKELEAFNTKVRLVREAVLDEAQRLRDEGILVFHLEELEEGLGALPDTSIARIYHAIVGG